MNRIIYLRLGILFALSFATSLSCGVQVKETKESKPDEWKSQFTIETFESLNGEKLLYRMLVPAVLKKDERYPLVLFLHGAGERGDNNEAQLVHGMEDFAKRRDKYPAFIIAPQCPNNKKWIEVPWDGDRHTAPADPSDTLAMCHELIGKMMKEQPVDPSRVYVTGLSMGGFGTFDAATRWPELFAAAAPICGGGDESAAAIEKLSQVPLWIAHGDKDNAVPVARSQRMVEALKKVDAKLTYVEMPGVGHNSWSATYADDSFFAWLFAQKKVELKK